MKQQKYITVKGNESGIRLDLFLVKKRSFFRPKAQELIQEGKVLVDGKTAIRASMRLQMGQKVEIAVDFHTDQRETTKALLAVSLPVVLEKTEDYLVLSKPAGIAMHPVGRSTRPTVASWLSQEYPEILGVGEDTKRPGIVHRLDADTSGVILVARTNKAFQGLKRLFQEREVEKTYLALVYGNLFQPSGVQTDPIGRIRGELKRGVPVPKRVFAGELRPAETEYALSTRYPQYDFLLVKPKTGRTHQIRVHLAALGHPIVGDRLYRFKEHRKDPLRPLHQLLHAAKIQFSWKGKKQQYQAPLPEEFQTILRILDGEARRRYDLSA